MTERTHVVLAVPDLDISAAWYRDVPGFEVRDMGDPGWRMFVCDGCTIMAGHGPDALPPADTGDHAYFGCFADDDIDRLHATWVARGVTLIKAIADEPWGMREFGIRSIDGHRIMVGQPLDIRSRVGNVPARRMSGCRRTPSRNRRRAPCARYCTQTRSVSSAGSNGRFSNAL